MDTLTIEATKYTPAINFDAGNSLLVIQGKSTPENTFEFFEPVLGWLKGYFSEERTATVEFDVPYFNSSSSRVMYDIFDILDKASNAGSKLTINWKYAKENENALETGEEFQEDFENLNISLVEI